MSKESRISCLIGKTVRSIIEQANQLGLAKSDIINMFPLGDQIYLIYYK